MTLQPTHTTGLYSAMMENFNYKWDIIFIDTLHKIGTLINEQVSVKETDEY